MKYKRFEEIPVWRQARKFTKTIYKTCSKTAFKNDFSLMDQIRRASVSIMLNIAEGFERRSNKEFARFVNIAKASAAEVRCVFYVALDEEYISQAKFDNLFEEITSISNQLAKFEKYLLETHKK